MSVDRCIMHFYRVRSQPSLQECVNQQVSAAEPVNDGVLFPVYKPLNKT